MANDIEKMICDNEKLVFYLYNKLPQTEVCIANKEDIIAEGMIGLWKGCKTYDETKGYKLATYLSRCITNEMYMYFRKLNKQPSCVSLDDVITVDESGGKMTIADTIMVEDDYSVFDIADYVKIYFNHFRSTTNTRYRIPIILSMLYEGETQLAIAKRLNISHSQVNKYIKNIRESIIREHKNEQRS